MKLIYMSALIATSILLLVQGRSNSRLNGEHLRIATVHNPPRFAVSKAADGETVFNGIIVDIVKWLQERLHFSYTFVVYNETELMSNDVQMTLILHIANGEADMGALLLSPTIERLAYIDVSFPIVISSFRIVVPWPEAESRLLAPIKPFQWPVWLLLLISISVIALMLSLVTIYYYRTRPTIRGVVTGRDLRRLLSDHSIYLLSTVTKQGESFSSLRLSLRFLAGTWGLVAIVFAYSYSGNLISFMTAPRTEEIPQSLEDLARNKQLNVSVQNGSPMTATLMRETSGPLKVLGDSLRANPDSLFRFHSQAVANLKSGKHAILVNDQEARYYISLGMRKSGQCLYTASKPLNYFQTYGFALPKNGPYNEAINQQLRYLLESGLFDQWAKKYLVSGHERCLNTDRKRTKVDSLTLEQCSSSFVVLVIGIIISSAVFLLENLILQSQNLYLKITVQPTGVILP